MSDYLFPREKKSFEEVFPELEDVTINVNYFRGGGRVETSATYTKDSFPGNGLSCSNRGCKNGGLPPFTIPSLIKKMIKEKATETESYEFCSGGLCGWGWDIKITAKYKEG